MIMKFLLLVQIVASNVGMHSMMQYWTIGVHPLTESPTAAWEMMSRQQTFFQLNVGIPTFPVSPYNVRVVCMSDTHMQNITYNVPDGDIFIHAGDFSNLGQRQSVIKFNNWLGSLPHKFKVVIAGNHELTFDTRCLNYFQQIMFIRGKSSAIEDVMHIQDYLTNCIYLQDSGIQLYGVKIYGSPWIPVHYGVGGAFSRYRGRDLLSQWNKIPSDTEILVTHTPPVGHGDLVQSGIRVGCVELLNTVLYRVRPKYHIFGHIHEGYGVTSNGEISFVNASSCNVKKNAVNLPIVFDMPLKYGYRK